MAEISKVYRDLCMFTVLRDITEKKLIASFMEYCEADGKADKLKAYGKFVAEIYKKGGNLAECVRKLIFENENVYVKSASFGKKINENIENALGRELDTLTEFVSLESHDFASDMGVEFDIPSYDSENTDINREYRERIVNIEKYGYGIFASNCMFSITDSGNIVPVISADTVSLDSFIGYKEERQKVIDNTLSFLSGKPCANILLYGDAGTGKSSTVKAVANHFFDDGLRLIEIRKNQLLMLPDIMGKISKNPLRFIIFIDDLSFNQGDDNFSMLKATLEGSASAVAKNAVIYTTSNRRHIVKETFGERDGSDVHRNDTLQESLSLSGRFGLTVLFAKPEKKLYLEIVGELAERHGITMDREELFVKAETFALSRGFRSARCAEQFINSLVK